MENVLVSLHSLKTMGLSPFGASAPLFLRNGELLGHSPIRNPHHSPRHDHYHGDWSRYVPFCTNVPVQSVPITTNVSLNPAHGEMYLIQHYVIIKVCQWLAAGLLFSSGTPVSSTTKTDCHNNWILFIYIYIIQFSVSCDEYA